MNSLTQHHGQSKEIAGLDFFAIALISRHRVDYMFANGNMQVGVIIAIRALGDDGKIVQLSDEQLDSIQLINYRNGNALSGGWSYSSIENSYVHQYPVGLAQSTLDSLHEAQLDKPYQQKIYWLTTTKVEPIQISAQILLNQQYTTRDSEYYKVV
ncbi:hypothetical protein, partial [Xenorhabdus sp. IM139775]|uniref:hypothetical protein n=1 Tax=Xenorhabdus sp. IM139775 TaxID=3025876 RepID=UPI0023586D68